MTPKKYERRSAGGTVGDGVLVRRAEGMRTGLWVIKCACGCEFVAQPSHSSGSCRKCAYKRSATASTKHGCAVARDGRIPNRLYRIWTGMRTRCRNEKNHTFSGYGARGITVCDEWRSFEKFMEWANSHGYAEHLTLDRIDGTGGYYPDNCRWATKKEQGRNKRTNHRVTILGETRPVSEWCELYGISHSAVYGNARKSGKTTEARLIELVERKARQ